MRTSNMWSPFTVRSAKAQPRNGTLAENLTPPLGCVPNSSRILVPLLFPGMNEWITSCNASMPKPLLAEPATKGMSLPAATARCKAASIMARGTSPSNSTKASIISSSTEARDSTCWLLNFLAHSKYLPPAISLWFSSIKEQSLAVQIEPSKTLRRLEPACLPAKCAGAKSTTGRMPRRFSSASTALSKAAMSSTLSIPLMKTTAGLAARSSAAKARQQAASTPLDAEMTAMAPWAMCNALSTMGARSTWPGVSTKCSLED
mmetsp:Transcript_144316/g.462267  ORF Transcript_144316/g.462267 Transcript_144316/m.462267 type:complete len:261 (+) Transcript_144316:1571-2353(+)